MYQNITEILRNEMKRDFVSVDIDKNPVAQMLTDGSTAFDCYQVIAQYCIFPENIVRFLQNARDVMEESGFTEIAEELERNIGEELGTQSAGKSHYDMLTESLQRELGYSVDTQMPCPSSSRFVNEMKAHTSHSSVAYVAGAVYALEASAKPELEIVQAFIDHSISLRNGIGIMDTELKLFFDGHIDTWEPGHEEGLREEFDKYLEAVDAEDFKQGFRSVMHTMDSWWQGLYQRFSGGNSE